MRVRLPLFACTVLLLQACAVSAPHAQTEAHGQGPAEANQHAATHFLTPGHAVPETAKRRAGGVPRDEAGRPYDYLHLGRELPAFSGPMLDGTRFSSDALGGQWTLIEVWGVWCSDSRRDAPYVQSLWNRIKADDDLAFLSVHVPQSAEKADMAYGRFASVDAYFEEESYSWPVMLDTDASIRETLAVRWTPSYILVAPDLTVQGYRNELATSGEEDPVSALLDLIDAVKASYDPDAPRPVED